MASLSRMVNSVDGDRIDQSTMSYKQTKARRTRVAVRRFTRDEETQEEIQSEETEFIPVGQRDSLLCELEDEPRLVVNVPVMNSRGKIVSWNQSISPLRDDFHWFFSRGYMEVVVQKPKPSTPGALMDIIKNGIWKVKARYPIMGGIDIDRGPRLLSESKVPVRREPEAPKIKVEDVCARPPQPKQVKQTPAKQYKPFVGRFPTQNHATIEFIMAHI